MLTHTLTVINASDTKPCRAKYYHAKLAYLKDCKPSAWWGEIQKLSGLSSASSSQDNLKNLSQCLEGAPKGVDLAKSINEAFLSPLSIFEPLPRDYEPQQHDVTEAPYVVSTDSVFTKLSYLNPKKAPVQMAYHRG